MNSVWNNLCRACLISKDSFKYELFKNVSSDMYCFCTSIEVEHDDLPKSLCNTCFELLTKYTEFKKTCIESQKSLVELTNRTDISDCEILGGKIDNIVPCGESSLPVKVKSEAYFNDDVLTIKTEDLSDHYNDELIEADNLSNGKDNTKQKKLKKRKIKKLEKLKQVRKLKGKLKINRKQFAFSCDICNRKFNYQERFEAHKLEHEGKVAIIHCLPCNKTFMTWSGLRRHNESEHTLVSLEKLKCSTCGKICKSQQTLKVHLSTHGERKMYVCNVCGKGFTTKFNLKIHLDTHKENRERQFTCEHCGKKFFTNTILLSHVSRRHTGRRFICQICSYPFTDKYNLAKHLLIHDGKKMYKCEICKKSFATHSSLVEHKRIHSGERPYICSYCPKSFLSKRRLDEHHRVHTGERPHKCSICGQGFTQRGTLKRHMKVHDRATVPVID